jgi:uncharacterized RDD family membrane protein YckC
MRKETAMYALPTDHRLPDPVTHAEFYQGVTLKRGFAWIIDTILIALITAVIVVLTVGVGLFILPLVFLTVSFLYRVLTLAGSSATPGMRMMNIQFLTREGVNFDLAHAFLHTLGYTLSIGTLLVQILSVFLMFASARGQGLTDHVLGTVAINRV